MKSVFTVTLIGYLVCLIILFTRNPKKELTTVRMIKSEATVQLYDSKVIITLIKYMLQSIESMTQSKINESRASISTFPFNIIINVYCIYTEFHIYLYLYINILTLLPDVNNKHTACNHLCFVYLHMKEEKKICEHYIARNER